MSTYKNALYRPFYCQFNDIFCAGVMRHDHKPDGVKDEKRT